MAASRDFQFRVSHVPQHHRRYVNCVIAGVLPPPPAPLFFRFQKVDKVVEVRNGIGRVITPGCEVGISPATSAPFQKSFCLRKEDKKKKEKEIK